MPNISVFRSREGGCQGYSDMQECGIWGMAVTSGIQTLQFPDTAAMVRQAGHIKRITTKAGT